MPQAHDLLWLSGRSGELHTPTPLPDWADSAWLAAAPAVVRREQAPAGLVPVGLRGMHRHQRHAAYLPLEHIQRRTSPEALVRSRAWENWPASGGLPCRRALQQLAPQLDALPWAWGITGGAGFAMASGLPVLRENSDLDLLLRMPCATDAAALHELARWLRDAPIRVDLQIDTGHGGFALAEWLRGDGPVLLKTDRGPRLVDDPWAVAEPT